MRRTGLGLSRALLLVLSFSPSFLAAATFTVTNTNDAGPGSLRQAILDANPHPGSTIAFAIGSGTQRIRPLTPLPQLRSGTLDGTTQSGFAGTPLIEIDGSFLPVSSACISMNNYSPGTTVLVRGLVINNCQTGIGAFSEAGYATTIQGNYVGTDPSGQIARPNSVGISANRGTTVGGTSPGEGNLVSGNVYGIVVHGPAVIVGNRIGTDSTGTLPVPNINEGIEVEYSSGVRIGGPTRVEGNLISGNVQFGIDLFYADDAVIENNVIGLDANGGTGLPTQRAAIMVYQSNRAKIGGAGGGNVLARSWEVALGVEGVSTRNTISQNSIFGNAFGIDLDYSSIHAGFVTPNDPCDADSGPNLLQNFPVLNSATTSGGTVTVRGTFESEPSSDFDLEFFSSPAANTSGYGEGQTYVGATHVTTDASCHASFLATFVADVSVGSVVTATATDAFGDTSEFSQAVTVAASTVAVTSIATDSGTAAGGVPITITGSGFQSGATVEVGGQPATSVSVDSSSQITATVPALTPGSLNTVVVTNPDLSTGGLANAWFADFADVPAAHPFHDFIEKLVRHAITAGCSGGNYCPADPVTRAQVAVFLLRSKNGPTYTPPPATGTVFADVTAGSFAASWIEALAATGVTAGCGGGNYCPLDAVTRAQMAVFLLRTKEGPSYTPPACSSPTFADVPCSSPFAPWVEELAARGITGGCGAGNYCPTSPVTRGQMAVFLVTTFALP
jgi:hypothetical protein